MVRAKVEILEKMNRLHKPLLSTTLLAASFGLLAQPTPQPDLVAGNVWYGAVPPGARAQVLVFIHGLSGDASYFWIGNDMYSMAYAAGYRTAFISMNADDTPNTASIPQNGTTIRSTLPVVARHYTTPELIMIGHSKGGLDIQYAMAKYPAIRGLVAAVFTLATSNQGSQLADWAFGPGKVLAGTLGLLSPGMANLRVATVQAYRAAFDPIFSAAGIPFYYLAGNSFTGRFPLGTTGRILKHISGEANDGFVAQFF